MSKSKPYVNVLIALVLQVFLLGLWVYTINPDPSLSILVLLIVPVLFGINLIIGGILYFLKKPIAKWFFINALVAPAIFFAFWIYSQKTWNERNYEEYTFRLKDRTLEFSLSKNSNYFSISDVTNQPTGSTTGLYFGFYNWSADTLYLTDQQVKMFVVQDSLFGMPQFPDGISLEEK